MTFPDKREISMVDISKRFGHVQANRDVSFNIRSHEIHGLIGQNGAGKSTLMNVLYGMTSPDAGTIRVDGQAVVFRSPADALAHGIGMVHQHLMLVPELTVAENVVLGTRPSGLEPFRMRDVIQEVEEISQRYSLGVDASTITGLLPLDLQQRAEIVKLLYRGVRTLLLDEPTAILGPREIVALLQVLKDLRDDGCSIVVITHKLEEVIQIADRITVLRNGSVIEEVPSGACSADRLAELMFGAELPVLDVPPAETMTDQVRLSVRNLNVLGDQGQRSIDDLTFEVRAGEILGIAGVEGNGQVELAQALAGTRETESGLLFLNSRDVTGASPASLRADGLGVVSEDRLTWDLIPDMSVAENLAIVDIARGRHRRGPWLDKESIEQNARALIARYEVTPSEPHVPAGDLSGGNQQKVVIARELSREPTVLLLSQPTRGLDAPSTIQVHREIASQRSRGAGVVLISNDLDEIFQLADRCLVLFRGKKTYEATRDQMSMNLVGNAIAGIVGAV